MSEATKEQNTDVKTVDEDIAEEKVVDFSVPCILGIDEAGRGPVLGPMVYAAAVCPISRKADLKALGVNDSKALKASERAALRKKLEDASFVRTFEESRSAQDLSEQMLAKRRHNLNQIAHDSALMLVEQALAAGCNVVEVYADTVGPPDSYADKFRRAFPSLAKVDVRKKADSIFPVVSAASIIAKTTRDRDLELWEDPKGIELSSARGSGYPGDEVTKKWLRESLDPVFGFPNLVRFSWSTAKTLLKEKAVHIEWEIFDDEEEADDMPRKNTNTSDITAFFGKKSTSKQKPEKSVPKKVPKMLTDLGLKRSETLF